MRQIHSDQGKQFEVLKKKRTSHHPQGNPLTERFVRTPGNMFRAYVSENHFDWDVRLPEIMAAY